MSVKIVYGDYYSLLEIPLDSERTEYEVQADGYVIGRLYLDGECYVSLDEADNPKLDLRLIATIERRDEKIRYIYITNPAQVGKKCILFIARKPEVIASVGRLGAVQILDAAGVTITPALKEQLPSTLTAAGNLKIALAESLITLDVVVSSHFRTGVTLLPSATRTASGVGADVDVGRYVMAEICLDVTAVSGTDPALNVYIEGKDVGSGKYKVLFSQAGITSVGTYWFTITHLAFRYMRVRWEISGTNPSFTFSVTAEMKA